MELVVGAMPSLIPKLKDLLKEEHKLQAGVKDQIRSLTLELESADAELRKVADVRPDQLDELVKIWAREVREASYDMEDILDTYLVHFEGIHNPNDQDSPLLKRLGEKMTGLFKKSKKHHNIAGAIEKFKKNLQELTDRRVRFTVDNIVAKPAVSSSTVDPRLTAMYREASQIIGIDKSSADLISMLSHKQRDESNQKMRVVSVVGVGGLGKTTLAKAVYEKVKSEFGCAAFVPVGQDPDLKKVFRDVLIDLDKKEYRDSKYTTLDERQLINELWDFLRTKRYFIVIDDIWEQQTWERIKLGLLENFRGSRIIMTTRKFDVARDADEVYKLGPLSDDKSKRLFYTRLFGGENKCPSGHVDELSDMILKNCGGVPLTIITMASSLLGKSRQEWIEVCNSSGFNRDKDDMDMENTMRILSLSYHDLPSHLKTCLLYLSIFPKDSFIDKSSLIWMWIAEGFVEKKPGRWSYEVGEEYFHDLINRSMIQGVDSEVYGILDGCRVYDMVLDLIIAKSLEENFVCADGVLSQSHTRRLAPQHRELDLSKDADVNLPQLRSFIVLQCAIVKWVLHPRLKLIRVLALENCKFREGCHSLEQIGNLLHLRYLGIRHSNLKELPEGIGALKFLQTLILEGIGTLELPCSIRRLTHLFCLRVEEVTVPDGVIGRLTSLEELQIRGPRDNDESWMQFVKDLGNLCELRVLEIIGCYPRATAERTHKDFMQSLGFLKKMQHLTPPSVLDMNSINMNAWDAAAPSQDLRSLSGVYVPRLPSWVSSAHLASLSRLVIMVDDLDEQGLMALARLRQLCNLSLQIIKGTVTCNIDPDRCFLKLRSWVLHDSMVQFAGNQDSSAFVTICHISEGMAKGRRRKKDNRRRVVPAVVVMPKLEQLEFSVEVKNLMEHKVVRCGHLGLEYLPSLQTVRVDFDCDGAFEDDVEREQAALRHAIQVHPNRPALELRCTGKEHMKRRSDDDDSEEDEETRCNDDAENDDDDGGDTKEDEEETKCCDDAGSTTGSDADASYPPHTQRMQNMHMEFDSLESILDGSESPKHVKLPFLQFITKDFSDELKIGSGGCGVVYKGMLRNQIIAVKRLLNNRTIDDKMFYREVESMMIVKHKNIVRFLGYCSHTEEQARKMDGKFIMAQDRERLLCFEYLINGSLENYLTDELRGLEWQTRYQIIKGVCDALHHLHNENHIIHMDLKPANILLDSNMVPKIIDFGVSRLDNKSQTMSSERLFSLGYCAPEYLIHGKMSSKSDIYSLGVIILELVTGSKLESNITKVHRRWKHRWNKTGKDEQLGYKQVATCLHLAERCMQIQPADRPNICDIISDLNKMDSTETETSNGTECLELEDMLGVEPLEIHRHFEPNKQISCSVELTNDTDDHFAFRISTTSLRPYCIKANDDTVPPRSKCIVTISLQALGKALPYHHCKDEFCVQSTRVDGRVVATNIGGHIFNEEQGKVIDAVNFSVVLTDTSSPSADQ